MLAVPTSKDFVIPVKTGIQGANVKPRQVALDSGFRRNDGSESMLSRPL